MPCSLVLGLTEAGNTGSLFAHRQLAAAGCTVFVDRHVSVSSIVLRKQRGVDIHQVCSTTWCGSRQPACLHALSRSDRHARTCFANLIALRPAVLAVDDARRQYATYLYVLQ